MSLDAPTYKAVLFDLDGVLVDMREAHYEALNLALLEFSTAINEEEHHNTFNGLPTLKKLEILVKEGRIPDGKTDYINNLKQEFTKKIVPDICVPESSKIEMLVHLKNHGLKIACCSNSTHDMVLFMLQSAGLYDYFDMTLGNDSVTKPKPDPEIYITAMEKFNVSPSETLIIEDSYYGIAAGRASGAVVIEVPGVEAVHMGLFAEIL